MIVQGKSLFYIGEEVGMSKKQKKEGPITMDMTPNLSRRAAREVGKKGAGMKKGRKSETLQMVSTVPFIGKNAEKNEIVLSDGNVGGFGTTVKTKVVPVLLSLLIVLCGVYGVSTVVFGQDPGTYLGGLTISANDIASNTYAMAMEAKDQSESKDLMAVSAASTSESYAITIGGAEVAVCASEGDANWVLDTIKKAYPGQSNGKISYTFKEDVGVVPSGQEPISREEALIKLENGAEEDKSFVNVVTTEVVETEKNVPFTTNKKNDNSIYTGETKVQTKGANGVTKTVTTIQYQNGEEIGRKNEDVVVKAAVTEVVLVGTKARPANNTSNKGGGGVSGAPKFIWPINATITSKFGQRWGRLHAGLDFGAKAGTPIKAAAAGTVTQAASGWNGGYGTVVVVQHNSAYSTRYAHMSRLGTSVGKKVSAGEVIGYVGNTGNSTGNHLHFEIRVNGVAKNPLPYLP